jgi:hypothetical protein
LHEKHSQAEDARQGNTKVTCCASEHFLRQCREQACAVTAGGIRIDSTAMRKPLQGHQSTVHYLMCCATAGPYDEARAACIMVWMAM